MKGLLVKDFKILKNQKSFFRILAVIIALYMMLGNVDFIISYVPGLSVFVAMSTLTYDMYDNGAAFLFTMPFSRKDYVRGKYLFSGLIVTAAWGISLLTAAGYICFKGGDLKETVISSVIFLAIAFLLIGLNIPMQLKFGAEKSRLTIIVMIGTFFGLLMAFFKITEKLEMKPDFTVFYAVSIKILILAAVILFFLMLYISYRCAVRILEKKEF